MFNSQFLILNCQFPKGLLLSHVEDFLSARGRIFFLARERNLYLYFDAVKVRNFDYGSRIAPALFRIKIATIA